MRARAVLAALLLSTAAIAQEPAIVVRGADARVSAARVAAAERLTRLAVETLKETFPGTPYRPFSVTVHADESSLPDDARRGLHPGTPGMALLGRGEIHIVLDRIGVRGPNDLRTVVVHEVVHELLDQYAGDRARFVPRWLHEGLAQVLSGDTYLGSREEDLIYPATTDRLIPFTELREDFPDEEHARRQAYAQSFSFVGFMCRRLGTDVVVRTVLRGTPEDWYRGAFLEQTGHHLLGEEALWKDYLVNESGAGWRFLFNNCFAYLMIAALVPLALAGIRRWTRDAEHRQKLEREEAMTEEQEPGA